MEIMDTKGELLTLWGFTWLSIPLATILFTILVPRLIRKCWIPGHGDGKGAKLGGLKSVPMVTGNGWIPLFGHILSYAWDVNGFLRRCEQTYGPIFKIQFFSSRFILLSDRELVTEFMAAEEEDMSFFAIFKVLYFYDVYACNKLPFQELVSLVMKKGVAANWRGIKSIGSLVDNEGRVMLERLTAVSGKMVDFREEMRYFVANLNARVFFGSPLSQECLRDLIEFFKLFNQIIMVSFSLPKFVIRLLFHSRISRLRDAAASGFFLQIQKYRDDPNLCDSYILRTLVDHVEEGSGARLSDMEIGRMIVIFMHIATENTVLGFGSVLSDCFLRPDIWRRCKEDVANFLTLSPDGQEVERADLEGLMSSNYLQAVLLESARHNSEAIQISRKPAPGASIKGYYVGDGDIVAVAPGLLHLHGNSARKLFKEPKEFNPDRFLKREQGGGGGESGAPTSILTWGAGVHYCPGKYLAIAEIKVALALTLLAIQREGVQFTIHKAFTSPGSFTDRSVQAKFS